METLLKFKQFVDEINLESSRNYKLSILEKYKDDEDILYLLKYIYDPCIITGISSKKAERRRTLCPIEMGDVIKRFYTIHELLEYIKNNNTGTDVVLGNIEAFISFYFIPEFPEECQLYTDLENLFDLIITKNVQLGIDAKTINKVIPSLVSEFNVQLANKYFDDPSKVDGKEFILTTKIDGCRIVAIKENGEVSFWTRQGQKYEGLVDLEEEMKEFMPDGIALDGELTLLNPYEVEYDDKGRPAVGRKLDSGEQYKATTKLCRTKDTEKHGLKMLVFDAMKASQFREQKCDTPYRQRRAFLEKQFATTNRSCPSCSAAGRHSFVYFDLLPVLYQGTDTSKIEEILNEQVAKGEEGIMINIADAPYRFKRSNDLLKVKLFNDLDLEVVGFEEGTNKNEGRLGALICKYGESTVKVGSGLSEELREDIWNHRDEWLGRTVVVKYFEETYDSKTGLKSLRFPIYIDYRTDKSAED